MAVLVVLRVTAIWSYSALDVYARIARTIRARSVVGAWLVATLATAGSLYFSEVAGFAPCTLCWYQRIAMYPLVVILGAAIVKRQGRAPAGSAALEIGRAHV